jgi:hypothetical protein
MKGLVTEKNGGGGAAGDRFGKDAVAVVVIEDNKIIVAVAGRSNKTALLISVDLACGFREGGEAGMGAKVRRIAGRKGEIWRGGFRKRGKARGKGRVGGLGGA